MDTSRGHRTTGSSKIPTRPKVELTEIKGSYRASGPPSRSHTTANSNKLSKTVGAKENLAPNKAFSSTDSLLVLPRIKPAAKSIGYLEMKRLNEELTSEIRSLQESSEPKEKKHMDAVNELAQEIAEQKKVHAELKSEIEHYQECLATKNAQLDALQQSLEAIKFENEQLAAVLEGAKLDAATGLKIQREESTSHRHKIEVEWEAQDRELDAFIVSLDSTISQLKVQESCIQMDVSSLAEH